MSRPLIVAAAAALGLAALPAADNGVSAPAMAQGRMAPGGPAVATTPAAYLQLAGASDLYEIQSSRIALAKTRNPTVRQFAQMLIRDHSNTTRQLMAAARASGLRPIAPTPMPMHARMLRELRNTPAANFDRVFLNQQVQAHEMALGLHSDWARRGNPPPLRAVARTAVPVIRMHLQQVRRWARM